MLELEPKDQSIFMIEKIKERPVNKRKLLRRTLITASMAVIFGLIACFTFLVLEPVLSNWLHPEEETDRIVFPEDFVEMLPEQMLSDKDKEAVQGGQEGNDLLLEKEQIDEILSEVVLNVKNYEQLYSSLMNYAEEMSRSMVTITGTESNVDWLDNVERSESETNGVLVANSGKSLLILADYSPIKKADELTATFCNGLQLPIALQDYDPLTYLAIFNCDTSGYSREYLNNVLDIATLGSSMSNSIEGTPVLAMGNPMGKSKSVGFGMITTGSGQRLSYDSTFRILQTDIVCSKDAGGVLFNLRGEVIGIVTNYHNNDMRNVLTAYGISNLKSRIEKLSNENKIPYLGIEGTNIPISALQELGLPNGAAYITDIAIDSPVMRAGIQRGDILVMMDHKSVRSFDEYVRYMKDAEIGKSVTLEIRRQVQDKYKVMEFDVVIDALE